MAFDSCAENVLIFFMMSPQRKTYTHIQLPASLPQVEARTVQASQKKIVFFVSPARPIFTSGLYVNKH